MKDQAAFMSLWHILFIVHIYKLMVGLVGFCCAMAARDCLGARQLYCRRRYGVWLVKIGGGGDIH
jgi:hypothetical protein